MTKRVEHQVEEQPQIELQVVHQIETDVEGLAGEKGLGLLARAGIPEQGGLEAILPREMQHVAAVGAEPGALREDPAGRPGQIGEGLGDDDPDKVAGSDMLVGNVAADLNYQPGRRGPEQFLQHHHRQHGEDRRSDQETEKVAGSKRAEGFGDHDRSGGRDAVGLCQKAKKQTDACFFASTRTGTACRGN